MQSGRYHIEIKKDYKVISVVRGKSLKEVMDRISRSIERGKKDA